MITAREQVPNLAKYELLEKIGLGGMATVYRARDKRLGRDVAVKLIHAHLRENTEVAVRFVSEARAVARLRHPNVVEVYDVSDENEPERYLVVELVRGTTLRALISKHKKLPAELAAAIGLEVAAGLSHAHEQGIIHRDVKPENVLVELVTPTTSSPAPATDRVERRRIKLTDFGIAKLLDAQGVTSTGQVLGSPAHMAPEQIEGGEVSARADVFALGVMLYECMVGRLPFDGKNPAQVLRRVLEGSYPPAAREEPKVGERFADVLAGALVHDPAGRYASVDAFADALRGELARVGIDEPRREVENFLADQDLYLREFGDRIVERLATSGEKARANGEFQLAAAQWNRALAYRPGDADLLGRATRLARRQRFLSVGRRGAAIALSAVVIGGAVFAWKKVVPVRRREAPVAAASVLPGVASAPTKVAAGVPSASPGAADPASPVAAKRKPVVIHEAPRPRPEATRPVQVGVIGGAKGGVVLIDGQRDENWFDQKPHDLSIGDHTFQFQPSDPECCVPVPPVTKTIDPGDTVAKVLLTLQFRDAVLKVEHSRPGVMRCSTLFNSEKTVPATWSVQMSSIRVQGQCTFVPSDQTQSPQVKEGVTLEPGRTTEISWP